MYSVLQTEESGKPLILTVLSDWCCEDNYYYWPGSSKYRQYLQAKTNHDNSWKKFKFVKILRTGIGKIHIF